MSVAIENIDSFMMQVQDDLNNKVSLLSGQKNVIEYAEFPSQESPSAGALPFSTGPWILTVFSFSSMRETFWP